MKKTEKIAEEFMNKFFGNWREFYEKFFDELNERMPRLLTPMISIDKHMYKAYIRFDDDVLLMLLYKLAAAMIEKQSALFCSKDYSLNCFSVKDITHEFTKAVEEFVDVME